MADTTLPVLLEPESLQPLIGNSQHLIIDLSPSESYNSFHIPRAVSLEYNNIVASRPPVAGLLPSAEELSRIFSTIGLTSDHHVIAYDNENNGKASRLLWTLDCLGHKKASLLNGGLTAWSNAGLPMNNQLPTINVSNYQAEIESSPIADKNYIMQHINDPSVVVLDTRSESEYKGEVVRAARGGHIPGAVNINWTDAIDSENDLKFRNQDALRELYHAAGVTPDKQVITYCQTHHRSAHSYIVLKSLGYSNLKGYHGAWSEWGNDNETPIEN